MKVVGLDLSLTSTGYSDGTYHVAYQTKPTQPVEHRLDYLVKCVLFQASVADLVLIEGSSFGSQGPGHEELAALRYMVRVELFKRRVPFVMIPPARLKLYTTGHGNATKAVMVTALDLRHRNGFAAVKVKDGRYDQADAFALAAMGYDYIGQRLAGNYEDFPVHTASLDAVNWPELYSDGE